MKTGYLFVLVLLIALAIPLFADHALVNPVSEFLAISIFSSEEEVEREHVSAVSFEILAIKPVGIKQSWLPSNSVRTKVNIANTLKSNKPRVNIRNNIHRRIRSPV